MCVGREPHVGGGTTTCGWGENHMWGPQIGMHHPAEYGNEMEYGRADGAWAAFCIGTAGGQGTKCRYNMAIAQGSKCCVQQGVFTSAGMPCCAQHHRQRPVGG